MLHRTNGSLQLQQSFSVTLSLDPLTADPELVGREIRNHLDAVGVRERHCVVCVPLKWALIVQTELPDLPEADVGSFLQIEAERGFPCDVATLRLGTSRWRAPTQKQYATLIGIPENHFTLLERALRGAKLKAVSFSLGVTALQPPDIDAANGILALAIGEDHIDLQITSGGGVAALRALEGALEAEGGRSCCFAPTWWHARRASLWDSCQRNFAEPCDGRASSARRTSHRSWLKNWKYGSKRRG